ncbi:MAG: phosphoribosyltransferase [Candidatus Methanoperedens sp.]|nr:phosphoribosyltransferase [Candidatus Methanoperedens sp.]
MEKSIKCYSVSWDEACRLARTLAHTIVGSGYKPDIIIGISRGGLVPARMVCDLLLLDEIITIRTEHWGTASRNEKARIKFSLPKEADISGKKVLVVDDIADTGDSFSLIMDYLKEKGPFDIRAAVFQYKTSSTFTPDYWGEKLEEWKWIIYPWAFYEDIVGFVRELLIQPSTNEELKISLLNKYNIPISRNDLLEILNDFHTLGKIKKCKKGRKILWEKIEPAKME